MNPRTAENAWLVAIAVLAAYEFWALRTNHMTLSRAVWTAEDSPYGLLLNVLAGGLAAHFFAASVPGILAFLFGFVGGGLFWHRVP